MTNFKKQLRINKMFMKRGAIPEDCDDLEKEIELLEKKLKEKENELFQVQRHKLKRKLITKKNKNEDYTRPENIVYKNGIVSAQRDLELYSMLTGMEVRSYVNGDHCCVVYHMQHNSKLALQHGLRISLANGNNELSKLSLPLGFNYNTVMEDYEKMMTPECLGAVRKALMAYYDRLEQFEALNHLIKMDAQLFKVMDGSHIEISFQVQSIEEPDPIEIVLMLDYRVYDIRPKHYSFKEIDISDHTLELLKEQCAVFKKKPLDKAFRKCFIEGSGPYKLNIDDELERQREEQERRQRERRRQDNYDQTFNPDSSGEE